MRLQFTRFLLKYLYLIKLNKYTHLFTGDNIAKSDYTIKAEA